MHIGCVWEHDCAKLVPCVPGVAHPHVVDGEVASQLRRVKVSEVVPRLQLIKHHAMKTYGGVDV
jgi:hypothetical protein